MAKWHISRKFRGVRWREHSKRKHGILPDCYFTIRYQTNGERCEEGLGWASEGWSESAAGLELAKLRNAVRTGEGHTRLSQKRAAAKADLEAKARAGITLQTFWDEDYYPAVQMRIKECSWEKEASHFEHWFKEKLGKLPLREISDRDLELVQKRMHKAKLSPRTQEYILGTFRRIWKHAAKRKIVNPLENPVNRLSIPKVNNCRLRAITPEELRAILLELEVRDQPARDVTLFAALTGCRASEAFSLKWEHVDLPRAALLFGQTKNGEAREIFLSKELVELLKSRGPGSFGEYVFTRSDGNPWQEAPSAFRTAVAHLDLNKGRTSREKISFHSLRHSAATVAARRGVPIKDMQIIFGWKTPSMVFRYAKGSEDVQRRAMQGLAQALAEDNAKLLHLPIKISSLGR